LEEAGMAVDTATRRGYDHGTWVPLALLYPDGDIPVVQLSVQPYAGPAHHVAIGKALAPLRDESVLIVGSGSFTHNLGEIFRHIATPDAPAVAEAKAFAEWTTQKLLDGATDDLVHYRERAPHAAHNHPTEEHFLPLFAAMGAGNGAGARHVHASHQYGALMMDAFAFD
ncbi:MAG: dioxygenase, partial [Rhodobiaceae bacterium]|nr:dioxygenase [Rhodobiaceae bacterium]